MPKKIYTDEVIEFLRENAPGTYSGDLAKMIEERFGIVTTGKNLRSILKSHGIKIGVKSFAFVHDKQRNFTDEQEAYLWSIRPGRTVPEIMVMFNQKYGTDFKAISFKNWCNKVGARCGVDCRFKKGSVPPNKGRKGYYAPGCEKGWFKKGHSPHNHRPVNSERITKDGYTEVKIAEPKKWRLKHLLIWEAVNGPLPEGHCIIFLDGNKQNFALENLRCISRQEEMILNHNGWRFDNSECTESGILLAKISHKARELKINERNK